MRYANEPSPRARVVRVTGREDLGEVVDEGKNIGSAKHLYCVGVHFPSTGEVVYYESSRVETIPVE